MAEPVLFDTVTLLHFGAIARLDILETRFGSRPEPRWTEAVFDELEACPGLPECTAALAARAWLGPPISPGATDHDPIHRLHIGLNEGRRPPLDHFGEAESIYFAHKVNGLFVTDDNDAYTFAERRIGVGRVLDTVAVLRDSVAMGELTAGEALNLANGIRNYGRFLRRVHPSTLTAAYFQ